MKDRGRPRASAIALDIPRRLCKGFFITTGRSATLSDQAGNTMAVTDSNGNAAALYTMEAFGNVQEIGLGDYLTEGSDTQPYHLTTREYDADVGLYYFNARWYDPATGRFVSRDAEKSVNAYPYCLSGPNCMDPVGRECISVRFGMTQLAFPWQAKLVKWTWLDWVFPDLVFSASGVKCPKSHPHRKGPARFTITYEIWWLPDFLHATRTEEWWGMCDYEAGYCETAIGTRAVVFKLGGTTNLEDVSVYLSCCETCEEAQKQ